MQITAIIPARYASSRFPGKPLADINGKPMIQRVYEQAMKSERLDAVIIATDDDRIMEAVQNFGGQAVMTRHDHPTGTDRVAEASAMLESKSDVIINIQGDEPHIDPAQIDALCEAFTDPNVNIATLYRPIESLADFQNENLVKAVVAKNGQILYFSRTALPHIRLKPLDQWLEYGEFYHHIGLYGFRSSTLLHLAQLDPTPLEQAEQLEQLRWLENGYTIHGVLTHHPSKGIDTPEDLL